MLSVVRCMKCGRPLTNKLSVARGFGPVCWSKLKKGGSIQLQLFEDVVQAMIDAKKKLEDAALVEVLEKDTEDMEV